MPNLAVSNLRPFIPARDFGQSKRFYAALGWETHDIDPRLALVRLADGQHFYLQDYYLKEFAENTMLHLTVEDAPAWHAHVASVLANGDFGDARVRPPARQDYGANVVFVIDPTGVLFHLCQWDR